MKKKLFLVVIFICVALFNSLIASVPAYFIVLGVAKLVGDPKLALSFLQMLIECFFVALMVLPFSWGKMCKMFTEAIKEADKNLLPKGV